VASGKAGPVAYGESINALGHLGPGELWRSTDGGRRWVRSAAPAPPGVAQIVPAGNGFIAVGTDRSELDANPRGNAQDIRTRPKLWSLDAAGTWTEAAGGDAVFGFGEGVGIAKLASVWVAAGRTQDNLAVVPNGARFWSSHDGRVWRAISAPPDGGAVPMALASDGHHLVVTGAVPPGYGNPLEDHLTTWTCTDGRSWRFHPPAGARSSVVLSVARAGGRWLAIGAQVLESGDGVHWTALANSGLSNWAIAQPDAKVVLAYTLEGPTAALEWQLLTWPPGG
jgi:hypothetical protein